MAGYITGDLVTDLWWFIENVPQEDPSRHDQFFALRERVRKYHEGKPHYTAGSGFMPIADAVELVLQLARDNCLGDTKEEFDRQVTACNVLEDFATNHLGED